jgi:hypothetical protein
MYGIYENGAVIAKLVVPMTVRPNQPIFSSDALSLKRHTSRRSAHRWEIETRLEPLTGGANTLFVYFVDKGHDGIVQVITPQNIGVIKARTSVSSVTATGTSGSSSITIANNSGLIPAGTFIRFGNHSKVYMTKADITGNGALSIYPNLRTAVPAGTSVKHRDDVIMNCKFDTDTVIGMQFEDGILMDNGVIKMIEAI